MGHKLAGIAFGLLTVLMVVWCWPPPRETAAPSPNAAAATAGADPSYRVAAPVAPPPQRAPADATTVVTLRGRVRDDRGPVAGASVQWFAEPRAPDDLPAGSATTDADGLFRGEARLGAERKFVAIATAEGHQATSVVGVANPRDVLIRMARWITISGCVREHDSGAPIAGATVTDQRQSAVTDTDGRYTLQAAILARAASLTAHAPGFAPQSAAVGSVDTRVDHDFTLRRVVAVPCIVVDRDTGAPVAGAALAGTYTEADGTCRVDLESAPATPVTVTAPGYLTLRWSGELAVAPPLPVHLPLARAAVIHGRVLDGAGQAVSGAAVYVTHAAWRTDRPLDTEQSTRWSLPGTAADRQPAASRALSSADGGFTLEVAPDLAAYQLHVHHNTGVTAAPIPVSVARAGERAEVEVRLTAVGRLVGRVTRGGNALRREVTWRHSETDARGSGFCDEDGRYRMEAVTPGRVVVAAREVTGQTLGEATVDVVAGQETCCDFALAELPGTIRGRVTAADGKPRAGCSVRAFAVHDRDVLNYDATTDDADAYVLRCALQAKYTVLVHEGEFVATHEGVVAPATGIDFTIPEFGLLRLQLIDAATKAPVRVAEHGRHEIAWRPSGAPALRHARVGVDANGRVELRLPQGRVDVSVALPRSGFARRFVADLEVTDAAQPPTIPIAMPRGVTWEVAIVGATSSREFLGANQVFLLATEQLTMVRDRATMPGVEPNHHFGGVNLWVEDPQLVNQRLVFDDRGIATLHGLAPGRYTLRVFPHGSSTSATQLALQPTTIDVGNQDGRSELTWQRR